eukprot:CAMPEP_0195628964 /NCGR_PEP_ID=MMETSP0815-20121206/19741_1 /TAXON_ID=97485 /ORGANISM="Prymnesium parvum, Strain Texoma1" /LENGTH=32 /DNA_ID= /DNA_START= /DNA_END= /DNA_ORIENTATION=
MVHAICNCGSEALWRSTPLKPAELCTSKYYGI